MRKHENSFAKVVRGPCILIGVPRTTVCEHTGWSKTDTQFYLWDNCGYSSQVAMLDVSVDILDNSFKTSTPFIDTGTVINETL